MKVRVLIAVTALMLGQGAFASGSMGGGAPRAQQQSSDYAKGKKVYLRKIACASCMMKGGVSDVASAQSLIEKLAQDQAGLDATERSQATAYLKRRFKIN